MTRLTPSPWLDALDRERPAVSLEGDASADVAVVGGGIAGVATCFFVLHRTDLTVALLERDRIGHGATGHNAGQVVSYFERPFTELAAEFGAARAAQAFNDVIGAWGLLEEVLSRVRTSAKLYEFTGYGGMSTAAQVRTALGEKETMAAAGVAVGATYVAEDAIEAVGLPERLARLCEVVPREDLSAMLRTPDPSYIAAQSSRKGCVNSAQLCEDAVAHLLREMPDRLRVFEATAATSVRPGGGVEVVTPCGVVECRHAVLCTNGYADVPVAGTGRVQRTSGMVGYMAGLVAPVGPPPGAVQYYTSTRNAFPEPYFYTTWRPHPRGTLICTGGPEIRIREGSYDETADDLPTAHEELRVFLRDTVSMDATRPDHFWKGLMGYTINGVRQVGRHPSEERVLYNRGCNGVGILPSLLGGRMVADILSGGGQEGSMFEPVEERGPS